MEVLFSVATGLLAFAAIIGMFWTVFGVPIGIILLILKHLSRVQLTKKKIFWTCFGGVIVLLGALVLFFIVSMVQGFLGIPSTFSLPTQP